MSVQQLGYEDPASQQAAVSDEHEHKGSDAGASGDDYEGGKLNHPEESSSPAGLEQMIDENAQAGVQNAEAITATWNKTSLGLVYTFMFLLYFVNAFQSSITGNLTAYVTSGFEAHSLIPVISIVSGVMSAAAYMPIAKILNLWDRSIGFAIMATIATIGLILSATCTNIETYAASQVFYSVGFAGMIYCIDVITADTSSLRDRGLAYAFTSSPYIITAFAGPKASEGFYESNWRWAFGCFAIILPVVAIPLFSILQYNRRLAKKRGLLVKVKSDRTLKQTIVHYVIEFDVLGVFLLAAGLVLFLLPFSIAASAADQWKSPHIIAMLVVGFVLLICFGVAERYLAPRPFIPYKLLTSRTVLGACLCDFVYQIAYYCWASYFTSFLQVNYDTSISVAGYISSIFDVVSGIWLIGVGLLIKKTGYFRWLFLGAIPLYMLGVGLMIYFRKPHMHLGYIIMCQIFLAVGGGTMIICQQVAVLAASSHNDAAAVLALLGLFGTCGGAVGNSISGAIWTHTLPNALERLLPAESLPDLQDIYDSLEIQLSYPIGDATREAIMYAYAEAQSRMLIAGTAIMALALGFVFLIKNIKVSEVEQVKGVLF
ncbi:hypothetical protein CI109_104940 [Kwoniella shandongensis]|uniref:Uncharacterized protein n=1 Tax=Kwoniella shandongensis TaxID=1734106 RepID=A0A5M6BR37_9TREE|nr:uncharacterized protein CI109_006265 [Kwoniella shandongensis]KAA5525366.1 hypothetical protein CI109_006265 [Kwoniella shandongensis]